MRKILIYAMAAFAFTTFSSFASEALPEAQDQESVCDAETSPSPSPSQEREPAAGKEIRETRIRN